MLVLYQGTEFLQRGAPGKHCDPRQLSDLYLPSDVPLLGKVRGSFFRRKSYRQKPFTRCADRRTADGNDFRVLRAEHDRRFRIPYLSSRSVRRKAYPDHDRKGEDYRSGDFRSVCFPECHEEASARKRSSRTAEYHFTGKPHGRRISHPSSGGGTQAERGDVPGA